MLVLLFYFYYIRQREMLKRLTKLSICSESTITKMVLQKRSKSLRNIGEKKMAQNNKTIITWTIKSPPKYHINV